MNKPTCKTCLLWENHNGHKGICHLSAIQCSGNVNVLIKGSGNYCEQHQDWADWEIFNDQPRPYDEATIQESKTVEVE